MSKRSKNKSADRATGTNAVHAGEEKASVFGAVATPIIQSATFFFEDNAELEDYLAGRKERHLYSRWSHPTAAVAEAKVAALEGAEAALLFSSGMAAISSAVLSFVKSGDKILALESIYGGTYEVFTNMCPRFGIEVQWARAEEMADAAKSADARTKLVYVESPTNPNLKVVDLRALTDAAHKRGIPVVIDNTFATPILQQPLKLGCDVVVHSATKYLSGHSDLICGFATGSKERMAQVYEFRKLFGGTLNAGSAGLLNRGMKTIELRVRRQCDNAMAIAQYLSTHPKVESVNYPGLPSDRYHTLAKSQMSGFTGMLSFTVKGGLEMARKVTDRFELILYAPSLGGVETIASLPVRTSHLHYSPEDLKRADVTEGMIRVSCGIEAAEDLIADLKQALG